MIALFGGAGFLMIRQLTYTPDAEAWRTDFTKTSAPMSNMVDIGGRNNFMPIDHPRWMSVNEVTWLADKSPVIVLVNEDSARAYPIVVLMEHGIVNDMLGTEPIAVTYCMLCNAPIVYQRTVNNVVLRFSATGTVNNSGFVMWDDQTESWWQQFTGQAIVGQYVGVSLVVVPSQVVGYRVFRDRYRDGKVLTGDVNKPPMSYGANPFVSYDSNPQPFMYSAPSDDRLFPTERVLAGVVSGQAVAYPFSILSRVGVVNDTVNGMPIVVLWQAGANSTHDQASVENSKDVGMAALFMRVFDGQALTFAYDEGRIIDTQTGSVWNIFGEAIEGELTGAILPPMNGSSCFWFSWAEYYPDTVIYTE